MNQSFMESYQLPTVSLNAFIRKQIARLLLYSVTSVKKTVTIFGSKPNLPHLVRDDLDCVKLIADASPRELTSYFSANARV